MNFLLFFFRNRKKFLFSILTVCFVGLFVFFNQTLHLDNITSSKSISSLFYTSFLIDYSYEKHLNVYNQTPVQQQTCRLPELKLIGHTNIQGYTRCKQRHEWGYLVKGRWYFNKRLMARFISFSCKYRNLTRQNDFELIYSEYETLTHRKEIYSDVIEVLCFADKMKYKYDSLHAQIVPKKPSVAEVRQHEENLKNIKISSGRPSCEPLNILLLSYDSLSRVSWFRRLPTTTRFILNQMKFDILYGQSIIGDGTPAMMIPLLTGKTESELPSVLKTDPNATYVDQVYPFIWKDLHKIGYKSFHMEDWPQVSCFTYRLRGFSNQTADHYMRAYQLSLWKRVSGAYFANKDDFCIGSVKRHKKALDLIEEFSEEYSKSRHIAIMHYIENSHDGNERASHLDVELLEFLKNNFQNGNFNNTAIFLFSDHGSRFSEERLSPQGDLEERMPFFSLYLPDSYKKANPTKYNNLLKNTKQITTAFDIHATIRDLTCLENLPEVPFRSTSSLLEDIPMNRTCEEAGVSLHYCVCEQDWKEISFNNQEPNDQNSMIVHKATLFTLDFLNKLLFSVSDYCYLLRLKELKRVRTVTIDGVTYFKINMETSPNNASYEALLIFNPSQEVFSIKSPVSISRTNPYGNQPNCLFRLPKNKILTVDLRKFCFCKV